MSLDLPGARSMVQSSASFSGCTLPQRLYTANSEGFAAEDTLPAG